MAFFDSPFAALKEKVKEQNKAAATPAKEPKPNPNKNEFKEIFVEPTSEEIAEFEEVLAWKQHKAQKQEELQNEFLQYTKEAKIKKI